MICADEDDSYHVVQFCESETLFAISFGHIDDFYLANQLIALQSSFSAATYLAIATQFGRANEATWPVNGSLITSLMAQPLFASMSDHIGRKLPYVLAVITYAISNSLSATGSSWRWYIGTRTVCGIGTGGMLGLGKHVHLKVKKLDLKLFRIHHID